MTVALAILRAVCDCGTIQTVCGMYDRRVALANKVRSDCHAWGSSPNIELYRIVLGIDSDAPGFSKVKIEPHLGTLTNAEGTIPHPNGNIKTSYVLQNGIWNIALTLPQKTTGKFLWKGKEYTLKSGENKFTL